MDKYKPDIIAITEIWPKNTKSKSEEEMFILNYDVFINKENKRGVALYLHKDLKAFECDIFDNVEFEESVWCQFVSVNGEKVLIGCIYRSSSTTNENKTKLFQILKSEKLTQFDKVCIVGDFNFPSMKWDGSWEGEENNDFMECLRDSFLTQKVKKPTRHRQGEKPNILDLVIVNDNQWISEIEHVASLGKSDHDVLIFQLYCMKKETPKAVKYRFKLNKGNYDKMRKIISEVDWDREEDKNVNDEWVFIKDKILNAMESCIPKIKQSQSKTSKPIWMTPKILRKIKTKYRTFKRYLESKTSQSYKNYIIARNKCSKEIKKNRKKHEKNIAKGAKNNPKNFWKYVQEKNKTNSGVQVLRNTDGSLSNSDELKANTLNSFFSSVFTREDISSAPKMEECSKSGGKAVTNILITPYAVQSILKGLDSNKAQGPDGIPPRVLKEISKEISKPLCKLFNKTLEEGVLPEDWKTAEVTAIFKKGSRNEPGNYRPVSLTCVLCKVLETIIRDSVVSHFQDNDLYTKCQHGFRKKRSCMTQLLLTMEDFTNYIEQNESFDVVYLDFRKAFDTVPHYRLLEKLKAYGIVGNVLKWIEAFLSGRTQKVRINDAMSTRADVLSGIPQGSILGPILFTIFINDLPDAVQSNCKIFADDTKLYDKSINHTKIQKDLDSLQAWSDTWNLKFNVSKCNVMHYGKTNPNQNYFMGANNQKIEINESKEEKDLGVNFDPQLSFDAHINKIINKANQRIGLIKRTFTYLNKDILLKLYKSLVRPHLEYGNIIWYPLLKRQSIAVEKVQRRATKLLRECKNLDYGQRLSYLNLHSLKGRRIRGDLIETYKIFNNKVDLQVNDLFKLNTTGITRNPEGKIFFVHYQTNKCKLALGKRVAHLWNSLPSNTKFAQTTNQFKNLLDKDQKFSRLLFEFD